MAAFIRKSTKQGLETKQNHVDGCFEAKANNKPKTHVLEKKQLHVGAFFFVGNSNKKNAMHVLENKLIYVDGNWRGNVTPEGAARPCTTLIKARQPIPLSLRAVRPWPPETNMWSDTVTQHAGGG